MAVNLGSSRFYRAPLLGHFKSALLVFGLACLLSACSTAPRIEEPRAVYSWSERMAQLTQQQDWQINGKIGIRHPQENTSASLNWTQQLNSYHVYMAGPLGQGAINIRGSQTGVVLETNSDGSYFADSPEALLQDRLGWSLPIQQLFYWIKGIPAPNSPHTKQLDSANRLISLNQNQWHISYPSYQYVSSMDLPSKIMLRYGSDIRVTLIIKEWQLGKSPL